MAKIKIEQEIHVCDICGEKADGDWFSVENLNGSIHREYSCPIDLCANHMGVYATTFSDTYRQERYSPFNNAMTEELIQRMRTHLNEVLESD